VLSLFCFKIRRIQQGKSDATFNVYDDGLQGDGFDNTVRTVSVQSDSKLIVGAIISILTELQLLIYVDCFKTGLGHLF
jgi:hypothetical protein